MSEASTLLVIGGVVIDGVVIDGAGGIGSAICRGATRDGWKVISWDLLKHNKGSGLHGQVDFRLRWDEH